MATDGTTSGEVKAGTAAEGGADYGSAVFPPFDSTTYPSQLLWLALAFAALYYLMARVALPRIAGILESRRDRIASDLDTAERLRQESDEAIAAYDAALAAARANASSIADSARESARAEADAKRQQLETELAGKLQTAEERIAEIKAEALREVGGIATDAASAIVAKLSDIDATATEVSDAVASVMEASHAG